jgi:hypothetical protein
MLVKQRRHRLGGLEEKLAPVVAVVADRRFSVMGGTEGISRQMVQLATVLVVMERLDLAEVEVQAADLTQVTMAERAEMADWATYGSTRDSVEPNSESDDCVGKCQNLRV